MKYIIILSLFAFTVSAQDKSVMINDTVYYMNHKIHPDKLIRLGYGSTANKDFAFVYLGNGLSGLTPITASWAKSDVLIEKIIKQRNRFLIRCKLLGNGPMMGIKIFFEVETAVDNKEIIL